MAIAYFEAVCDLNNPSGVLQGKSVFLAGGITNCPDWQSEIVSQLKNIDKNVNRFNLNIYNPRRKTFDITNPKETENQIAWEFAALRKCEYNLFWFSEGSLNPIVLFELGSALERKDIDNLIIGCHLNYERRQDVIHQVACKHPSAPIQTSIRGIVADLIHRVGPTYISEPVLRPKYGLDL
jgi:hypothetical protein